MTGALRQVAAAIRSRSAAFGFLIAQIAFGTVVVSHALVLGRLFHDQRALRGVDMEATFSIAVESDDLAAPARDLATLRALPGVRAAAWTSRPPVVARVMGQPVVANGVRVPTWEAYGSGGLAAANGFALAEGRDLADADAAEAGDRPAVITAALAGTLFGRRSALGQVFETPALGLRHRVVGVLREAGVTAPVVLFSQNVVLHPAAPAAARHAEYVVNVGPGQRRGFATAAVAALKAADPRKFVRVEPIRATLVRMFDVHDGVVFMFGLIVALVLGVVLLGVVGMSSFLVAERLREIGIRRALGATRRDISRWFLFENFAVTTLGLALGAALSFLLNRGFVLPAMPVAVLDMRYLLLAMILFWVTGLVAASRPAARAAAVPPAIASRTV